MRRTNGATEGEEVGLRKKKKGAKPENKIRRRRRIRGRGESQEKIECGGPSVKDKKKKKKTIPKEISMTPCSS